MGAGAYLRLASQGCTFPSQNSRFGTYWLFSHVGGPSPLCKELLYVSLFASVLLLRSNLAL